MQPHSRSLDEDRVLRSQVTVTTKSGQQILVPVIVYIVGSPPGN